MKIIVDAMGGDKAPLEILKGCALAQQQYDIDLLLTGNEPLIRQIIAQNDIELKSYEIVHTEEVITMEDEPTDVLKDKKESSLGLAFSLLKSGRGDAVVSAGSTGAILVGATMTVGRIRGIKRPALATLLPSGNGITMLTDCGANAECRPEMLLQFAVMGSVYMNRIEGIERPRVMLANVGTEDTKGGSLQKEAFDLLKASPINFCGNVEGRQLFSDVADVIVTDGFSGNLMLKTAEGTAGMMYRNLKAVFKKNALSRLSAALIMSGLKEFKKKMDYTEYGGAPLLGISAPVIKAHGSSNANAFKNAIRQAVEFCNKKVIEEISDYLLQRREEQP